MYRGEKPGAVERALAKSQRPQLRALCALDNLELLELINRQLEEESAYDREVFRAARALLDERAPLPEEWVPETSREEFVRRYAPWFEGVELPPAPPEREPRRLGGARLARGLIAAVILIAALLSVTALASPKNPIQYVVDKGEQLVRTISQGPSGALTIPEGTDTASQYSTLEEALEDLGAENVQRITWIPQRFSLSFVETQVIDPVTRFGVLACFTSGDAQLLYYVSYNPAGGVYSIEKDAGSYEQLELDGTEYDITSNNGRMQAHWWRDGYFNTLTGPISKEELETILRSLE